ncbi:MAG: PEGA domain-containing protein [Sandaracinaceae bacterium]|nr:PEGA domain-containing protein [Sandaracinaceae bacterium]
MSLRTAAIGTLALTLVALPAAAQDACDAACHLERGLTARAGGDDETAATHFEAAVALEPTPRALAQLALAQQALGRWVDAEAHLVRALAAADPWITDHRRVLEGALETIREHLGTLVVTSGVRGARLRVNGRDAGTLPLAAPISVEVGTAVVDVEAPGHVPVQRPAEITAGRLTRVEITLVPRASARPPIEPEPAPPAEPGELAAPDEPAAPPTRSEGPSVALILGAVGAPTTAVALVLTFVALAAREANVLVWNDPAQCPPFPSGRRAACPEVHAAWTTAQDWAIAGAVTSGVLAAISATLFAVAASEPGAPSATQVELDVGPDFAAARVRTAF